ncbi:MAG: recombination protein RecR [Simkania negevensis]|nr:recombination protein RecR [Simkania negevensis]
MKYPRDLNTLIAHLRRLPSVGKKTAERFAFKLLSWEEKELYALGTLLSTIKQKIELCSSCGCLTENMRCDFCNTSKRNSSLLCIIASPRDVYAIEETGNFDGLYYVLASLLSPLEGKTLDKLKLAHLKERIQKWGVEEMIIALDSTLEGDATALYLKEQFQGEGIRVSRLAHGLPLGSSLDFVDGGTLAQALLGRQKF